MNHTSIKSLPTMDGKMKRPRTSPSFQCRAIPNTFFGVTSKMLLDLLMRTIFEKSFALKRRPCKMETLILSNFAVGLYQHVHHLDQVLAVASTAS
mmetsp:Transcript_4069/g.9418  ORF Transcript_4069/g.9418 Transcript_4069/m.9418 type:complete len:95 (+) Transcript_4069:56-340(+)